jgi:hypothetical protein
LSKPDQLSSYVYDRTFGPFLAALKERLSLPS